MRTATLFSEEDLTRFLQVMLRTFDELNYRQEPRLHLELGLMKLVHLQRLLPLEQILSGIAGRRAPAAPARSNKPKRPAAHAGTGAARAAKAQASRRLPPSSWTGSASRAQRRRPGRLPNLPGQPVRGSESSPAKPGRRAESGLWNRSLLPDGSG